MPVGVGIFYGFSVFRVDLGKIAFTTVQPYTIGTYRTEAFAKALETASQQGFDRFRK